MTLPISRIEPRVPDSFGSCARIRPTTALQTSACVRRFSASVASQASPVISCIGPSPNRRPLPPATEKRPSIRPKAATHAPTASRAWRFVSEVGRMEGDPPPGGLHPVGKLAAVVLVPRRDEDRRSLGREPYGRRGGDPGRAGHEADPTGESVHRAMARTPLDICMPPNLRACPAARSVLSQARFAGN